MATAAGKSTDTPSEDALAAAFLEERDWVSEYITMGSLWNPLRSRQMITETEEDKLKKFVQGEQVTGLVDMLKRKMKLGEFYVLLKENHGHIIKKLTPLIYRDVKSVTKDSIRMAAESMLINNRPTLVSQLKMVDEIIEQLLSSGTLTKNEYEFYLEEEKPIRKKSSLIAIIEIKKEFGIFSKCLRVSGQNKLCQIMVESDLVKPVPDNELNMLAYLVFCKYGTGDPKEINIPSHIQTSLDKCAKLQEMINVERLLDLLEDEGCLTTEMTTTIKQQPGEKVKVIKLVDRVKEGKLYGYFVVTQFLNISRQKDLMVEIIDEHTTFRLERMDELLREVYYNLLGGVASKHKGLEERLGVDVRDFVTLCINKDSNAVNRRGVEEAIDRSSGKEIKLEELFDNQQNDNRTRTVLMIGAPGSGKSTAVIQLARLATAKKTPYLPRPPFVIPLRSVNMNTDTTLKKLLAQRGPPLKDTDLDVVWPTLTSYAAEVTVILDGADEVPGFFDNYNGTVELPESTANTGDILNSLISGKLLPDARVLVTTRPFGLVKCWERFDLKVEVVGFSEDSLDRFLKNEIQDEKKIEKVWNFLDGRIDIRSLLLTPLHAVTFAVHTRDTDDDLLLQSRTEISMSLVESLVKKSLQKEHGIAIPRGKRILVKKLCRRIAELLTKELAIKTEMRVKDLQAKKVDIAGDDDDDDLEDDKAEKKADEYLKTGLLIKKTIIEDDTADSIFEAPHHSILESMAAIGLNEKQILKLVKHNEGRHDLVLAYVAGILGNEKVRKMIQDMHVMGSKGKDFKILAEEVVTSILESKRRVLLGGEDFFQRIVIESQQWGFIENLLCVMGTNWLTPDSSEALMVADRLIRQDPRGDTDDPPVRVRVEGIQNMRFCPRAKALKHDGELTVDDNIAHLKNISSVILQKAGITRKSLVDVIRQLRRLQELKAVNMDDNEVGSALDMDPSVLACLPSLQYLNLSSCRLRTRDVAAVTSSRPSLRHLDISRNRSIRAVGVETNSLTGLSVEGCRLNGGDVVEMAGKNGQTLKFFNATHIYSVSSAHINTILTKCPHLVELYTRGGELVQALSERNDVKLNHLYLHDCNLSSSSSSSDLVSLPMLGRVLSRHESIKSLTLVACSPFTPCVMSNLQSSVASVASVPSVPSVPSVASEASITSLFISPSHIPPISDDVVSLISASDRLTQLWLDQVSGTWSKSDYIKVIRAFKDSVKVVGLDVTRLTVDEVREVVKQSSNSLIRLWLGVNREKTWEYAKVKLDKEPGVVQLVSCLYDTYVRKSGLLYQHLSTSFPDDFRPRIPESVLS